MSRFAADQWLEQAQRLLAHQRESFEFLARVRERFPTVHRGHAVAVATLWTAAEELDGTLCHLLGELNRGLLSNQAALDTTRGVGVAPLGVKEEALYYNCTWTLEWGKGQGLALDLILDPDERAFFLQVTSRRSREAAMLRYPPLDEAALKEALVKAFVAEATVDDHPGLDAPPSPTQGPEP